MDSQQAQMLTQERVCSKPQNQCAKWKLIELMGMLKVTMMGVNVITVN